MDSRQANRNRINGRDFELRVRKDLHERGYQVLKNDTDVDLEEKKIIQAKKSYNPFTKRLGYQNGFPDLVYYKTGVFETTVNAVEVKSNGKLSRAEKDKCQWLLYNRVYCKIYIAVKTKFKGRIVIEYRDFEYRDFEDYNDK